MKEVYTPFGHSDYQTIVANIKKFSAGGKTAVVSTINGDSNVPFYKELANQGLKATDVPVVAFSVGEEELRGIDTKPLVGNLAAWNYFESVDNPTNQTPLSRPTKPTRKPISCRMPIPSSPTIRWKRPMSACICGRRRLKSGDNRRGQSARGNGGPVVQRARPAFTLTMDATNHHLHKPVMIGGEIEGNGQFNVVWQTEQPVRAQPWSRLSPGMTKT